MEEVPLEIPVELSLQIADDWDPSTTTTIPPCVAENPAWRHAGDAPTTTNETPAQRHSESRDRVLDLRAFSVLYLVAYKLLLG